MPTKPTKSVQASSVQMLNAIRNNQGDSYKAHIPVAYAEGDIVNGETITRDRALQRLRDIGRAFQIYQPEQNAFLSELVNRIGRVMLTSRLYENPWAMFKQGFLEYGETVEEIFVNVIQAIQFDPDDAQETLFKRYMPDVRAAFHTMNFQKVYPQSISEQQLRQAFLSFEGVSDLISKIVENIYTSANYDEFLMLKYMVARSILDGRMYPHEVPALTADNTDDVVVNLKTLSENVTFMSTKYNYAGVTTYTDKDYQYFILTTEALSNIDVRSLAVAYNLEYVRLMGHIVPVDSFVMTGEEQNRVLNLLYDTSPGRPESLFTADELTTLESCPGVMVDRQWFMVFDNLFEMKQQENTKGLYWQYFLHVWKTFSTSPFVTAIALTTSENSVTGVTITPASATMLPGTQMVLSASVQTTGLATTGVKWTVNSDISSINQDGLLTVPSRETAATLTVTATSLFDPTKSATATITLSGNTVSDPGDNTSLE